MGSKTNKACKRTRLRQLRTHAAMMRNQMRRTRGVAKSTANEAESSQSQNNTFHEIIITPDGEIVTPTKNEQKYEYEINVETVEDDDEEDLPKDREEETNLKTKYVEELIQRAKRKKKIEAIKRIEKSKRIEEARKREIECKLKKRKLRECKKYGRLLAEKLFNLDEETCKILMNKIDDLVRQTDMEGEGTTASDIISSVNPILKNETTEASRPSTSLKDTDFFIEIKKEHSDNDVM